MSSKKPQKTGKISYIFTKETLGMTLLLFSAIVLLMLFTRDWIFAALGREICTFMYGTFGYGSILVVAYLAYLGVRLTFEKKIKVDKKYLLLAIAATVVIFLLFHSVTTRNFSVDSFGGYLYDCYNSAADGWSGYTFGGSLCGLLVYPVAKLTTFIGAYVLFSALLLLCGYFAFLIIRRKSPAKAVAENEAAAVEYAAPQNPGEATAYRAEEPANTANAVNSSPETSENMRFAAENAEPLSAGKSAPDENKDKYSRKNLGRKILFENGEFDAESYRRNMIFSEDSYFNHPADGVESYLSNFKTNKPESGSDDRQSYTQSYQEEVADRSGNAAPTNYVYGEKPVETLSDISEPRAYVPSAEPFVPYEAKESFGRARNSETQPVPTVAEENSQPTAQREEENGAEGREFIRGDGLSRARFTAEENAEPPAEQEAVRAEENKPEEKPRSILSSLFGSEARRGERRENPDEARGGRSDSKINIFDDDNTDSEEDVFGRNRGNFSREETPEIGARSLRGGRVEEEPRPARDGEAGFGAADRRSAPFRPSGSGRETEEPVKEEKPRHVWKKYVAPSLDLLDDYPENNNVNTGEIEENKRIIVDTLDKFKIASEVANVTVGPAITRYDVIIADRTNIKRSLGYRDEIAIALMKNNVNAYLNYAKGALSIEIPNNKRTVVGLKTMLASSQFINSKPNSLTFGLGKNVDGDVVCPNITKMPHLLVAGTTGSGKSICLNTLLVSLLYKYGPEELRLILVDPKQAEFVPFARLPHLMINEILYEIDKVIKALNWAIKEMERRYTLFKEMTENGVATKNLDEYNEHLPEGEEKLPKILIVLDEFGDLMMQAKKEIEFKIIRLAQKARACGIHLILATQRPSVDCITGLIKSNLPSRIGFKVNSFDDSRTIFDIGGAEKLLGMGDMYFRSPDRPELERIQGCFIDSHEVQKVTDFVRAHNETYFDQEASDFINKVEEPEAPQSLGGDAGDDAGDGKMDDTYLKALKYCIASNQASVSMIQRRFPVGYIKACKIIDWMEKMNYITQSEGSKPRKVLMTMDEFTNTYGEVDD